MNPEPRTDLGTQARAGIPSTMTIPSFQQYNDAADTMNGLTQSDNNTLIHNKLLPELMSRIFELCVHSQQEMRWEDALFERGDYPKGYFKPLHLGAICRGWRDIAWSTHSLWNKVFILLNNTLASEEHAHAWLSRPGYHSLTLYVACKNDVQTSTESHSSESLIQTIVQSSSRWSGLFLFGSCKWISQMCASIPEEPCSPFLETLKLKPSSHQSDLSSIFPAKKVLPPSFGIFLKNKRESSIKHLNVDWLNVTHLELSHLSAIECVVIIEQAPRLISLSVEDFNKSGTQLNGSPLVHDSLQSLKLYSRYSQSNPYLEFFPNVLFPALRELHCEFIPSHDARSLEHLRTFIERSDCSLKRLSLVPGSSSDQELILMLESMHSLEDLHITSASWLKAENGEPFGLLWDQIGNTANFLPSLRSLNYLSRIPEIPWSRFPGVFGDIDCNASQEPRRLLNSLKIISSTPPPVSDSAYVDSEPEDDDFVEGPDKDLIDRDTTVRFLQLKRAGMTIEIYNAYDDTQDLLKRSMDIHKVDG